MAGDPAVGRGFLELVERGRSAAVLNLMSVQDLLGPSRVGASGRRPWLTFDGGTPP